MSYVVAHLKIILCLSKSFLKNIPNFYICILFLTVFQSLNLAEGNERDAWRENMGHQNARALVREREKKGGGPEREN